MARITPEKKVQNKIIGLLKAHDYEHGGPILWMRRDAFGANYKKGSADVWCVVNGTHIEIEVKAPGGKRSPDQERWEKICLMVGCKYIVTDNYEAFEEFIQPYLNK